jgi:hypothetical protein
MSHSVNKGKDEKRHFLRIPERPAECRYIKRDAKEVRTMDITSGIARLSMDMASARVTAGVQTAMLKNVMDAQQDNLSILLESLGMGEQLNIRA